MLPSEQRLRDNRAFRRVYGQGRSYANELCVLYLWRRQGLAREEALGRRIGFVVSKKQGKAVQRNRIKRRLREAVRLRLPELRPGAYDLVFVCRKGLGTADGKAIQAAVTKLLLQANVLTDGEKTQ